MPICSLYCAVLCCICLFFSALCVLSLFFFFFCCVEAPRAVAVAFASLCRLTALVVIYLSTHPGPHAQLHPRASLYTRGDEVHFHAELSGGCGDVLLLHAAFLAIRSGPFPSVRGGQGEKAELYVLNCSVTRKKQTNEKAT